MQWRSFRVCARVCVVACGSDVIGLLQSCTYSVLHYIYIYIYIYYFMLGGCVVVVCGYDVQLWCAVSRVSTVQQLNWVNAMVFTSRLDNICLCVLCACVLCVLCVCVCV